MNEQNPYIIGKMKAAQAQTQHSSVEQTQERIPPGQRVVPSMIAMPPIVKEYPHINPETWALRVYGEVENECTLDWNAFRNLGKKEFVVDFHCVTHWSKLDQKFVGIPFFEIINLVKPTANVKHVVFECVEGYTTNVEYFDVANHIAFLAFEMDGKPIEDKFGGPVRVVIPHLYGWKSAKWVTGIRFVSKDEPGFWEVRGYHNHANPWDEERYG